MTSNDTLATCPETALDPRLPGGNPSGGTDGADRAEIATQQPTIDPLVEEIQSVLLDNIEQAAACSHRPENVRRLFIDANARYLLAQAIVERIDAIGYEVDGRARLALTDDDLAALGRLRGLTQDAAGIYVASDGSSIDCYDTAQTMYQYLLGEA